MSPEIPSTEPIQRDSPTNGQTRAAHPQCLGIHRLGFVPQRPCTHQQHPVQRTSGRRDDTLTRSGSTTKSATVRRGTSSSKGHTKILVISIMAQPDTCLVSRPSLSCAWRDGLNREPERADPNLGTGGVWRPMETTQPTKRRSDGESSTHNAAAEVSLASSVRSMGEHLGGAWDRNAGLPPACTP